MVAFKTGFEKMQTVMVFIYNIDFLSFQPEKKGDTIIETHFIDSADLLMFYEYSNG
jgi:hypothetical protein